jgi:pectin lyase
MLNAAPRSLLLVLLASARSISATNYGSPAGFASGTTGGGNAPCRVPANNAQFLAWVSDNVPRCILVDRTIDLKGSMGRVNGPGCRPSEDVCGAGGQLAVTTPDSQTWCSGAHYQVSRATASVLLLLTQ